MRKMSVPACFGPLFLSMCVAAALLVPMASTRALHAQTQTAPAAGASVVVRMMDAVNSANDPAGKQYRASVTKAVDAGNGVTIPQGAVAAVTLVNSGNGSGWTTQLVSVTINGQPVAVTSSSASLAGGVQNASSNAVSAVGSMLGGFGHHVSAPKGVAAVATGQRVVLPPGATLTFVLSQPPVPNVAASTSPAAPPAAPPAPAAQPTTASAAPAPTAAAPSAAPATASTASSAGGVFIFCSTSTGAGIDTYYTGVFQTTRFTMHGPWYVIDQSIPNEFSAYLTQKGYKFKPGSASTCYAQRTEAEAKAAQHTRAYGGGGGLGDNCCGHGKIVETGWKDTP